MNTIGTMNAAEALRKVEGMDKVETIGNSGTMNAAQETWRRVVKAEDVPVNAGGTVLVDGRQIAIFHFKETDQWFACQNQCPHKGDMVLGRGLIGDEKGEPKVACPMHKKAFSLVSGKNLGGEDYCIDRFPVKIENGFVYVGLKPL